MKKIMMVLITILALAAAGCSQPNEPINQETMVKDENTIMEKDSIIQDEISTMQSRYNGNLLAGKTSLYLDFTKEDYNNALKKNKIIVLNFYASWCPTCKAEQPEAFAAFNDMNYENVVGFRVNYKDSDTDADEEALAKEFGIPYQHTKVILKNGQKVAKSLEAWNRQRYLDEIAKVQ
ncbi:MAG: thioredoxin family protein [Nanoarchaeota archaeon]